MSSIHSEVVRVRNVGDTYRGCMTDGGITIYTLTHRGTTRTFVYLWDDLTQYREIPLPGTDGLTYFEEFLPAEILVTELRRIADAFRLDGLSEAVIDEQTRRDSYILTDHVTGTVLEVLGLDTRPPFAEQESWILSVLDASVADMAEDHHLVAALTMGLPISLDIISSYTTTRQVFYAN